ncbi:MAG: ABC transporter permease [Phycisphaeraceae bacterium]
MISALRQLVRNRASAVALALLVVLLVMAVFAPWLAPYGPLETAGVSRQAPDFAHWLGTDAEGRDILSRTIFGARISLQVAGVSVLLALAVGGTLGVLAGYFGGLVDEALSRLTDMMFAFPDIVLALVIMAVLGESRTNLMIAIGVVYTPIFARIARGAVLSVTRQPFIEAARALGAGHLRIILRHVTPNIAAPMTVQVTLSLAFAILAEAALSFLGLGVEPDAPSWGNMLMAGRAVDIQAHWWVPVFPGVAITLAVLSFNVLGDGLRDVLDPRHHEGA